MEKVNPMQRLQVDAVAEGVPGLVEKRGSSAPGGEWN
jgi:hypothetical protein